MSAPNHARAVRAGAPDRHVFADAGRRAAGLHATAAAPAPSLWSAPTRSAGRRELLKLSGGNDGSVPTTVEVWEAEVVGTFAVPDGPGPHPGVVALSGSGGGVPSWWGDLLAPHGIAVLAAAYFGVDPLPAALYEIPVETVAAAGKWLHRQPEVRDGRVGLVGVLKGSRAGVARGDCVPRTCSVPWPLSHRAASHGSESTSPAGSPTHRPGQAGPSLAARCRSCRRCRVSSSSGPSEACARTRPN